MAAQGAVKRLPPLMAAVLVALLCVTNLAVSPISVGASQPAPDRDGTVWLCRPGQANDPCTASLTTTVISSDGSRHVVHLKPAANPPIDCFYLYPNVSEQDSANANLHIDPQQTAIAELEASPFSQDCRVYAPMYREDTGRDPTSQRAERITERSVLSGWHDYLEHYNHGRGFVLLGHSEGSYQIAGDLLATIDQTPALRKRFVSAIVTGANLPVFTTGFGPLKTIGPCQSDNQTGCVVDFNAFSKPPPPDTMFGIQVPNTFDGHAVEVSVHESGRSQRRQRHSPLHVSHSASYPRGGRQFQPGRPSRPDSWNIDTVGRVRRAVHRSVRDIGSGTRSPGPFRRARSGSGRLSERAMGSARGRPERGHGQPRSARPVRGNVLPASNGRYGSRLAGDVPRVGAPAPSPWRRVEHRPASVTAAGSA